jgi:hypothetical protein
MAVRFPQNHGREDPLRGWLNLLQLDRQVDLRKLVASLLCTISPLGAVAVAAREETIELSLQS